MAKQNQLQPILNNQFEPQYRDTWGKHLPAALEYARPVLESECHVIRYFQVPDDRQAHFVTAGEYRETTLSVAPGSFLVGFQQKIESEALCLIQITDQATGHSLFSQPMPNELLYRAGAYFLPCPMPILAPGILLIQVWARQADAECSMVLVVAELDMEYAQTRGCLNAC